MRPLCFRRSYDANTASVPLSLWARDSGHGDEGGHGFDAVPEVLQAEVFVGGMLVVVVVGDGDADGAGVGGSFHGVERDGAAGGGEEGDFAAGGLAAARYVAGGGGGG